MITPNTWENLVLEVVNECTDIIHEYYRDFQMGIVKLDWSPKRRTHRGGIYARGPGINMAMRMLAGTGTTDPFRKLPVYHINEYASFNNDRHIGQAYSYCPADVVRIYTSHEMAHAWAESEATLERVEIKPHGDEFKDCYKILRSRVANIHLPNQDMARKDYQNRLNAQKKACLK